MDRIYTACQVARRTQETFVQHVVVGGQRKRFEFTEEILWLLTSESQLLVMHGGIVLREYSTYTDHYGYLTSMDRAEECERLAASFSITPNSSAVLVVKTTVNLDPVIETPENLRENEVRPTGRKAVFSNLPNDWRREVLNEEGQQTYPSISRVIHAEGITWSSKDSAATNVAKAAEFRKRWDAEIVVCAVRASAETCVAL